MKSKLSFLLMQILRKTLIRFGITTLRNNSYYEVLNQRNKALLELILIEDQKLKKGLAGIVFSKDRPLQLYTLLETYNNLVKNPVNLVIIYKSSTNEYSQGYKKVFNLYKNSKSKFTFIKESSSFKNTLDNVLESLNIKNIFFLVDDIIFIRKIDLSLAASLDTSKFILSLRHSPHLRRSYTSNMEQMPPKFHPSKFNNTINEFSWFEEKNEWSNPYSVDGHILSLAEIYAISRVSSYSGPNTFEYAISSFNSLSENKRGLCYSESKILNLPINRVQNESNNVSGSVSTSFLLKKWQQDMAIDTSFFSGYIPEATHEEHIINFKKIKSAL